MQENRFRLLAQQMKARVWVQESAPWEETFPVLTQAIPLPDLWISLASVEVAQRPPKVKRSRSSPVLHPRRHRPNNFHIR
jgi:hypothetical protein